MLKVIKSLSEINPHFKYCKRQLIPCVTLKFYTKTAILKGDFDSTGLELTPEQINKMRIEEENLIEKYRPYIRSCAFYGRYPEIKVDVSVAYKFAMEIAKIMCKYAAIEFSEANIEDGFPVVEVLETTEHSCAIRCPYCGMIHYHGIDSIGGHVVSHCQVKAADDKGYIVKRR